MSLPSENNDDVYITFSEKENNMVISTETYQAKMKDIYRDITGVYGYYLTTKQNQLGFTPIRFKKIRENYQVVKITPPPQNIELPKIRERYTIPIVPTLIGDYSNYKITERDIVGQSESWQLSKSQILDWIDLNKDNQDFINALAICMIIADKYDYDRREFLFVDYCAIFIGIDANENNRRLENKIQLKLDKNHIWMQVNIPNKYYASDGSVREASYLWIDPTWFDNGNIYNFNSFTWGGDYVPQFMEGYSGDGDQCHKSPENVKWEERNFTVPGMTYSVVYLDGRYVCVQDDFGRRQSDR
jgi:hypothetical protein